MRLEDIQRVTDKGVNSGGGHGPQPLGGPFNVQSSQPRVGYFWNVTFVSYKLEIPNSIDPTFNVKLSVGNVEIDDANFQSTVLDANGVFQNAYAQPFTLYPGQEVRLTVSGLFDSGVNTVTLVTSGTIEKN